MGNILTGWPASPSKQVVFFTRYGYGWLYREFISNPPPENEKGPKPSLYLLHPQAPRLNLNADSQMILHLLVKLRVWCKQLFNGTILATPALVYIITRLTREEAVV